MSYQKPLSRLLTLWLVVDCWTIPPLSMHLWTHLSGEKDIWPVFSLTSEIDGRNNIWLGSVNTPESQGRRTKKSHSSRRHSTHLCGQDTQTTVERKKRGKKRNCCGDETTSHSAEVMTVDNSLRKALLKRPIWKLYLLEINVLDEDAINAKAVQQDSR